MDWTPPLEAIRLAIASAASLPDQIGPVTARTTRAVEWKNRKTGNRVIKGQWINLRAPAIIGIGRDETRYDVDAQTDPDDPNTAAVVPVVMGNRLLRIELECRSDSQEPGLTAAMIAERVRSRIRLPEVRAILAAQDVGFSHIEFSTPEDYHDADDRMISESIMEIVFLKSVFDRATTVPAGEGNDFFQAVEVEGELDEAFDGTTMDVAVTVDERP